MSSYKVFTFNPTTDDVSFFNFVKSSDFPWYYQAAVGSRSFLGHTVMIRDPSSKPVEGTSNSSYFKKTKELFLKCCKDNDISLNTILRISFNLTFSDRKYDNTVHLDHPFPHKSFLLYLTSPNVGGQTLLYINGEHESPVKIPAKENTFLVFDGSIPHDIVSCGLGERRIVLVVTFV